MADLYKNKYRITSARHPHWDYRWAAAYFITICTDGRLPFFGNIQNGFMCINPIGTIVYNEWVQTPVIRPDMNLSLGEFVVMPNHFHGILIIGENEYNLQRNAQRRDAMHCVSTLRAFGPQRKNVSSILRGFKSAVTKQARQITPDFKWQARFHDHIIRDDASFQRISNYINNNPANWGKDKFYQ